MYNNRPVERFFYIRGQTAVSLMEQLPSPEAKMDAETSKQLFETHSRAYNLDDPPFRMEVMHCLLTACITVGPSLQKDSACVLRSLLFLLQCAPALFMDLRTTDLLSFCVW